MTGVVRQKDEQFKDLLSLMINGTLIIDRCCYLINLCFSNQKIIDDTIHLVTQLKHGIIRLLNT